MMKIAVLVSGGGTNLQAIIDAIEAGKITDTSISVVISNNEDAYALTRAQKHHIPAECISPQSFPDRPTFHQALIQRLKDYKVDLVVLAGYLVTISKEMVEAFPKKIINIHPSLIPSFCGQGYYGLKVHEAALKRGVKVTGATVHYVDEGTDTGPIILQKAVEIPEGITAQELQRKVMEEAEWIILPQAIQCISSKRAKEQN
jgi:phosphoribosylglycinamide formyltransferase-1